MEQEYNAYCMKCSKHKKNMYSFKKISFDFPIQPKKKNSPKVKVPVDSYLYYCDKCDEFYVNSNRVKNDASVLVKDIYGGLYITNCKNNQNIVNASGIKEVNEYIDTKLVINELIKIIGIKSITLGYDSNVCKYDGCKLSRTEDISIHINRIQKKSNISQVSSRSYVCECCKRMYIKNNIIAALEYHIKDYDDILYIKKTALDGKKVFTRRFPDLRYINKTENIKILKELIETNTDYSDKDYKICNVIPKRCSDGALLVPNDKLLRFRIGENDYFIKGYYCKKCHCLYICDSEVKNSTRDLERSILNKEYSNVKVLQAYGFEKTKTRKLKPDQLYKKGITYRDAYDNRNISNNIIIRSVLNKKNYGALDSIIRMYGYRVVSLVDNVECESLDDEIISFFDVNNVDDVFYNVQSFNNELIKFVNNNHLRCVYSERQIINDIESDYFDIHLQYSFENLSCDIVFCVYLDEFFGNNSDKGIADSINKSYIEFMVEENSCQYSLDKNKELHGFLRNKFDNRIVSMISKIRKADLYDSQSILVDILNNEICKIEKNGKKKEYHYRISYNDLIFDYSVEEKGPKNDDGIITASIINKRITYCFIDKNRSILNDNIIPAFMRQNIAKANQNKDEVIEAPPNKKKNEKSDKDIKERILNAADFLVRTSNYQCTNRDHSLVRINAVVRVMGRGGITEVELPAYFCVKCNRYYILDSDYEQLKKYGYICCRVDTFESLINPKKGIYGRLKDQSILMNYGYNVDKRKGLTEEQRQDILAFMIDNSIIKKSKIIDHLKFLISISQNMPNRHDAIVKWKNDIKFVQNHEKVEANVYVKSIKVPIRRVSLNTKSRIEK